MTADEIRELERQSIRAFVESCAESFDQKTVLDFGCGIQPYRAIVETAGGDYTGYDRQRFPANVSQGDVGGYPPEKVWDVVLVNQVDQYVPEIDDLFNFLFRLLKPGGELVFTGPTNWPVVEPEDLRRMTAAGARHVATQAGFRVRDVTSRAEVDLGGIRFSLGYGMRAIRSHAVIYALVCPKTRAVRYVGKTTQSPQRRLRAHVGSALGQWKMKGQQKHLWRWIRTLAPLEPSLLVLETDPEDVDAAERRWIGKFRNEGARLCNMTNGGDGQKRGYHHSAAEVARRRARIVTPETRARMSAGQTGKKRSPEFREKMREIALARPRLISDDDVAAIRASDLRPRELAQRFGISEGYVYGIRSGRLPRR